MPDTLLSLWQIAAIFAGFLLAAFSWRISREIEMERRRETTWVTLADLLVGMSFVLLAMVVILPALGFLWVSGTVRLLGLAVLVFAGYPFVLVGHYNLYGQWGRTTPRGRVTRQELTAFIVVGLLAAVYVGASSVYGFGGWWLEQPGGWFSYESLPEP